VPIDLHVECERLNHLAHRRRDPEVRAAMFEALHSKWEGVQVTAARILARWDDAQALGAVRDYLVAVAGKERRQSACREVASALAPTMREADMDWVLDLYFGSSRRGNRTMLAILFAGLPRAPTLAAIERRKATYNVDPRDEKLATMELANGRSRPGLDAATAPTGATRQRRRPA
jgi:hypothetical protein